MVNTVNSSSIVIKTTFTVADIIFTYNVLLEDLYNNCYNLSINYYYY